MQEFSGNVLVWIGLILFAAQAILSIVKLWKEIGKADRGTALYKQIYELIVETFPLAALGVIGIWLGSNILGW